MPLSKWQTILNGLKDEWWTAWLVVPYALVMTPAFVCAVEDPMNTADAVLKGFEAIKQFPELYNYFTGAAVATALGLPKYAKFNGDKTILNRK